MTRLFAADEPLSARRWSQGARSERSGEHLLNLLPDSSLVYLDGAGHDVLGDRPDDAVACIRAFLDARPLPLPATRETTIPPSFEGPA